MSFEKSKSSKEFLEILTKATRLENVITSRIKCEKIPTWKNSILQHSSSYIPEIHSLRDTSKTSDKFDDPSYQCCSRSLPENNIIPENEDMFPSAQIQNIFYDFPGGKNTQKIPRRSNYKLVFETELPEDLNLEQSHSSEFQQETSLYALRATSPHSQASRRIDSSTRERRSGKSTKQPISGIAEVSRALK